MALFKVAEWSNDSEIPLNLGESTILTCKRLRRKSRKRKSDHKSAESPKEAPPLPQTQTPTARTHLSDRKRVASNQKTSKVTSSVCKRLEEGQFRYINEKLYTTRSEEAVALFEDDPDLFETYHRGFQAQVAKWPANPLENIAADIRKMDKSLVVADFGCGEALLARSVPQSVHSFDLVSVDPSIVACDMANVPLESASVDVAVFCLSLMGTNLIDFVMEARRVLRIGGVLKIAEVASRFLSIEQFVTAVTSLGYSFLAQNQTSSFFVFIDFKKTAKKVTPKAVAKTRLSLRPCLYKKR